MRLHRRSLHTDEMCNFYVMFYTESATAVPHVMCGDEKRRAVTGPLPAEAGTALARNAAYEAVAAGEVRQGNNRGRGGRREAAAPPPRRRPASSSRFSDYEYDGGRRPSPADRDDYFYYEVANERGRQRADGETDGETDGVTERDGYADWRATGHDRPPLPTPPVTAATPPPFLSPAPQQAPAGAEDGRRTATLTSECRSS